MPSKSCLAGLLLLAVVSTACETTQPQTVDKQTVEVRFFGTGAVAFSSMSGVGIKSFDTFQFFEDGDLDRTTDDPVDDQIYLWCTNIRSTQPHNTPSSVPWTYTLRISIIPAGETEAVPLTSDLSLAFAPAVNLTAYDGTNVNSVMLSTRNPICLDAANNENTPCFRCSLNPARSCQTDNDCINANAGLCELNVNVVRMFRFIANTQRRLSQATRPVATALANPLADVVASFDEVGQGRCSEQDPGPPVIDGQDSFHLEINKGDTIIVEARRGANAPPGLPVFGAVASQVSLTANFLVDGIPSNVNGDTVTDPVAGAGLRFTFTSR